MLEKSYFSKCISEAGTLVTILRESYLRGQVQRFSQRTDFFFFFWAQTFNGGNSVLEQVKEEEEWFGETGLQNIHRDIGNHDYGSICILWTERNLLNHAICFLT